MAWNVLCPSSGPVLMDTGGRRGSQCAGDIDNRSAAESCLRILKRALEAPARQIAENSSYDSGVIVDRMRAGTGNYGFDAAKGQYVDLIEAGIIDPTEVVRIALENAVSVASLLLLAEATLTKIPESKPAAVPSSEL